ncbi:MAG: hypothetical protein M1839_005423 [Geoglossum umbratile]|nr:MAG: hypothetical protein M1839_005423 [Geoglossum umbratile]
MVVSGLYEDEEVYDMLKDWASIQKICSDVEESNLTILLKLRRQHSGEVLFESRDAPLALTSHLIIENNDIQQRLGEASPASEITPVNLELIPDVGNINGTILSRLSTKDRLLPDPIKEYPVDQYQDMVTHHSGRDAHTDIGKIQWQHFALEEVTQAMPTAVFRTRSSRVSSGEELDRETLALLNESREMGERNAMSHDSESDMQRFYDIHGIFAGSNTQIGLAVDLAKLVLGFESVSQNDASDETEPIRSKCTLFKIGNKEDLTFFDWQVNGACQMLLRTLGYVPLPAAHKTRPEVKSALGRLSCLAVHGGILADQTGLGKTKQTLLFLSYYTQFHIEMHDQSPVHRPILLVVPSQVVKQWADDIIDYFPDFNLLISYDPTVLGHKFFGHTVGSVAMGELPAHDANSNFPQRWTFLFDTQDPRASKTILLTSYDTHAERSIIEELLPSTKRRKNDGAEYRYRSRMKDLFAMVILDEGHRMRNTYTKTWASISLLHAKYHWLITATPVVNSPLDMVGQLALLWPSVKAIIKDHPAVESLCNSNSSFIVLERLAAYKDKDPNDIRLLAALDPAHIQALIKSKDIILIREVYHVTDDLLTIRRSASSVLRKSEQGGEIVLKKLMKPFFVRTVTLNLRDNEAEELQWLHRLAARKYYSMLRGWEQKSGAGTLPPTTLGPNQAKAMYLPIGPLRDMAIASASVLLGRFNLFICQAGFKTLVDDLALYREYGFAARWFIQFVWRDGDPILKTRLDMLRYLCYGSPTLRQILYDVLTYVLPTISEDGEKITRGEKLIIPEATPIVAYFWEFCLRFVYVHATVLHSGLSNSRRQELMDDFNDPEGKTQVLIIMHDVSCQGINIHYDCHRITIPTCPRSASLEFQIWGRVLRVMQKHDVFITRTHVVNTHDTWRESKQTDKASIELASRANHPKVKELLVKLLNENQYEVKNVHDAMKGEYFRSYAGIEEAKQVVGLHISVDSGNNHDEYDDDEHDDDEHGDYDDDDDDDGDDDRDQDYVPSEDEGVQDTESDTVQSPLWPSKKRTDDREMLDPDLSALEAMLKLPYDYTYTTDDLDQPQTFIRAIKLLYNARMGRAGSASRTTLHLRYDQLHESVVESIGRKMKLDENDVATLHVMLQKREQFSANLKKAAKRAKGASSGKGTNKRSSPLSTAQEGTGSLKPQAKKLKQSSIGENRQVTAEGAEEAEGVEGVEGAEGVAMAEMVKEATAMEE